MVRLTGWVNVSHWVSSLGDDMDPLKDDGMKANNLAVNMGIMNMAFESVDDNI
jgi:hypothetical protein